MLAGGGWRIRHLDWENAPAGRDAYASAPARWWLGSLALVIRATRHLPTGIAVERAALWADPLLHLLLLLSAAVFVRWRFGPAEAMATSIGFAAVYPFAGSFAAGQPDGHALAWALAFWSVLLVVSASLESPGASPPGEAIRRRRKHFALAGVAGGLGLWVDAGSAATVIAGLGLGGIVAGALASRRDDGGAVDAWLPWRIWALAGALTSLGAYLLEFWGSGVPVRLEVNHPVYGLAWLGWGELAWRAGLGGKAGASRIRMVAGCIIGLVAVAALPLAMHHEGTLSLFSLDLGGSRLAPLPDAPAAPDLGSWLHRSGLDLPGAATFLPWLPALAALALGLRRWRSGAATPLIVVSVAAVLALAVSVVHLRWWNLADAILLGAIPVLLAAIPAAGRRWGFALGTAALIPGVIALLPPPSRPGSIEFTQRETEDLIERELAHGLADRSDAPGAVVLAPPDRTASWCFHGGLRGIGTADWENRDGLAATLAIIRAITVTEAQARISERQVGFLVLPSWDADLDQFARWSLANPEDAFVSALHHWAIPAWLRPIPYPLPAVPGFENESVVVLKVTDDSGRAAALSNLAEYFLESKQPDLAAPLDELLARFPSDAGALAARAAIEKARHDPALDRTVGALVSALQSGADRSLPWDRRISVAAVLAAAGQEDLARDQLRRALPRIDAPGLRLLGPLSLYRLLYLCRAYRLSLDDRLRAVATGLLPAELRRRMED
ncbi:MAG TPA: hypothetical protein VGM73_04450 [Candidatus Didemnitutus sp.]